MVEAVTPLRGCVGYVERDGGGSDTVKGMCWLCRT